MNTCRHVRDLIAKDFLRSGELPVGARLPTIQQLAAKYSVSATTVGKAVALMEAEGWVTKRRGSGIYVAALPRHLDPIPYRSNYRIGCVIDSLSSSLAYRLFGGIERIARKRNCIVEIRTTDYDINEERRQVQLMVENGVQGIILCPTPYRKKGEEYLATEFRDFPIVVSDLYQPSMERSHLIFDNLSAGREMTEFLLSQKRRNIAFLKYRDVVHRSVDDRVAGYCRALQDAGIPFRPENILTFNFDESGADQYAAMEKFLALEVRPDALIVLDDLHVHDTIHFLEMNGVSVPEDVLVVGFDNIQESAWSHRFPTTNPNFANLGERAVELLLQMLEDKKLRQREIILQCPILLPNKTQGLFGKGVSHASFAKSHL